MTESLEAIRRAVKEYREMKDPTGDDMVRWLQIITTHQFTLAEVKAEYYKKWQSIVFEKVGEFNGKNISRASNIADIKVPELVFLRHVLKASEDVVDALRSHLSHLKSLKEV
jgi:hypothetical protein